MKKEDLRDYQIRLIKEIKERKGILLAVDMGLGKTIACLTAIEEMGNSLKKILIVAPLRVAQTTWPEEFNNWEHLKNLTYTVIKGNPEQRLKCLQSNAKIFIINRENIPWLYEQLGSNFFDCIIWDECSSLKGGKMKTAKGELSRFGALCKMTVNANRVILLTGTPSPNGLQDLWGQIKALMPNSEDFNNYLGKSKNKFLEKYFKNVSFTRDFPMWKPLDGSFEKVMSLIEDLIIKMKSEDYLTLPNFLVINNYITLEQKERKIYQELKNNLITNDQEIVAANPAVLINKLLQLTSGCIYKEDGSYNVYHTQKVDTLKELIEETDENILLFYNFKHEKEQLIKNFKDIRILKTEQDLKDWNAGKIKLLACHPASAGHGLNLQHGGNIMVWLSLPWSLELYQQANKRLHRSGQKNNVKCYHFIMKDTVDQYVLNVLQGKDTAQNILFNLMKGL